MATARSQSKPKSIIPTPFGIMMNTRQRPALIPPTHTLGFRTAAAFTTGLTMPTGYTIYSDQLATLGGLTTYPIAAQSPSSIRYITTAGHPTGPYTIGVLPMINGISAPTGYIINGGATANMTLANNQLGHTYPETAYITNTPTGTIGPITGMRNNVRYAPY